MRLFTHGREAFFRRLDFEPNEKEAPPETHTRTVIRSEAQAINMTSKSAKKPEDAIGMATEGTLNASATNITRTTRGFRHPPIRSVLPLLGFAISSSHTPQRQRCLVSALLRHSLKPDVSNGDWTAPRVSIVFYRSYIHLGSPCMQGTHLPVSVINQARRAS